MVAADCYRILGRDPAVRSIPRPSRVLPQVHPDDREPWWRPLGSRRDETAQGYDAEHQIVRPDGQVREVHSRRPRRTLRRRAASPG